MNDQTITTPKPYAVVVVFSRWPLGDICAFLEEELNLKQEQLGVMRIDRFQEKETNRTIMLVDREILNTAEAKGYTEHQRGLDFKMAEYELRKQSLPREGFTNNFFIPLPEELSGEDARAQLQGKLEVLCRFGMFSETQTPRLKLPMKSRETGGHRGQAFVTFAKDTPVETIALARTLLHDTRLYTGEHDWQRMRCFWAKANDNKEGSKGPRKQGRNQKDNKPREGKQNKKTGPKRKAAPPKKGLIKTTDVVPNTNESPQPVTPDQEVQNTQTKHTEQNQTKHTEPTQTERPVDLTTSQASLPAVNANTELPPVNLSGLSFPTLKAN